MMKSSVGVNHKFTKNVSMDTFLRHEVIYTLMILFTLQSSTLKEVVDFFLIWYKYVCRTFF